MRFVMFQFATVILSAGVLGFWVLVAAQQANRKEYVLELSMKPTKIPRSELRHYKKFDPNLHFTNNSKNALEFLHNGGDFFQYIDISITDKDGKNHAEWKFGDAYIILGSKNKKDVVQPGERTGGTIVLPISDDILPGTYKVKAILTYKDLKVSSNEVQLVIDP